MLILAGIFAMLRNIPRAFPFFRNSSSSMVAIQSYGSALDWLDRSISKPSVIWSSTGFATFVPIKTKHYVLFHPSGALQVLSDKELEERYLVSEYLSGGATRAGIEKDIGLYGGAGKALKGPKMQEHFDSMYKHYINDIEPNIAAYLRLFDVRYVVVDNTDSFENTQVNKIKHREVYRDSNLAIFEILP